MRHQLQWTPDFFKDIICATKINKIPKIRQFIVSQWGYTGKQIVRENSNQADGYWKVKDHKFLDYSP